MRADLRVEHHVHIALDAFCDAMTDKNLERVVSLFAVDSEATALGFESDDVAVGLPNVRAFFSRVLERPATYSWEWTRRLVCGTGDIAWLVAEGELIATAAGGGITHSRHTLTGVLVKQNGVWLWMQMHTSE
jgi:ketosteroid isomerase-like protein